MKKFNMQPACRCAILLIVLLLAACSSVRLSYNHGDTLTYWWLDTYLDLDSKQKVWVKKDIAELFRWHRKTQLDDYAQLLSTAQKQLQTGNVSKADLLAHYAQIRKRTELLLLKALPELADLAMTLRPAQIARLEKKFASNNDEFRKKTLRGDAAKQQQYRYDKTMEQFELWFGSFSREQQESIRKASDARPLDNAIWLDERVRRQDHIVALVRKVQAEKLDKDATMALIRKLIEDSVERMEQSERKAFFDTYADGTAQMVLTVIRLATPAQKAHALKRMQGWIDDFNALAAEAPH